MGRSRILILAVAAVAAVALAFIVRGMAAGPAPAAPVAAAPAAAPKAMAKVLVASRDLPIGTRLAETDVRWLDWPADALSPSFITDGSAPAPQPVAAGAADQVVKAAGEAAAVATEALLSQTAAPVAALTGAIVKEPIFANEPISDRKLVRSGQSGYMAVVLSPGMRALAVGVSVESGAGGFILPGDRVDILQTRKSDAGHTTATVMRNVRVLAIDQTTNAAPDAKSVVGAVATLEVSAEDAEHILQAKSQGDLALALRSYADIAEPTTRAGGRKPVAEAVEARPEPRIWRGGKASPAT